jgi:hypothetical protein
MSQEAVICDERASNSMMRISKIAGLLLLAGVCMLHGDAQSTATRPAPTPTPEILITPPSDDDLKLDIRKVLTEQPDYVADESFFYWEGFGGLSGKSHVAKKGSRRFEDTGFVKVITDGDQIYRLNDSSKTFDQSTFRRGLSLGNGHPIELEDLLARNDVEYRILGNQTVNSHPCLKIEAKLKGSTAQIFLYAAKDIRYLAVAVEVVTPPKKSTQQLTNISLDVPAGLLEVPAEYKPIAKHLWSRLKTAKIIYEGKPAKNASVFRSEDGGKLFVSLDEPHPASGAPINWTYLVFLKEGKAEVAYEGTLITKDGDLAWKSKDDEAVSKGEDAPSNDPPCEKKGCPKVVVTTNSVYFPSVYWDDRKAMVKVIW